MVDGVALGYKWEVWLFLPRSGFPARGVARGYARRAEEVPAYVTAGDRPSR